MQSLKNPNFPFFIITSILTILCFLIFLSSFKGIFLCYSIIMFIFSASNLVQRHIYYNRLIDDLKIDYKNFKKK